MKKLTLIFLSLITTTFYAQNENKKWYFGMYAALDFMSNPPTILSNSSMTVQEGCASVADGAGNLLFYMNGTTVWNQTHSIMANGSGLLGNLSSTQGAMIIKKPSSSNLYYVFTAEQLGQPDGLRYSIIDMSLAAGLGSVTAKNVLLYTPTTEKLTGVRHCNGVDAWIVSHEMLTNNFSAYLLTAAGINMVPVISSLGTIHVGNSAVPIGQMKISPNGKKLALVMTGATETELYDFDNSTGVVSNSLVLSSTLLTPYGCEFSPDGSKFFACGGGQVNGWLNQWDLCAGSNSAVIASQTVISSVSNLYGMQTAPDGKIYIAHPVQQNLGVINNPNAYGALCNYVNTGQSVAPKQSANCFPNFLTSDYKTVAASYNYSISCHSVSFAANSTNSNICNATTYNIINCLWNFGDPPSGAANTSTLISPNHFYATPGTYTAKVTVNYSCGSDTLLQVINITAVSPSFTITGPTTICKGENAKLVANGAYSYSWSTASTAASVVVSPTVNTNFTVTATSSLTGCSAVQVASISVKPCVGLSDADGTMENVSFYPNPANEILFVETDRPVQITICNQIGEIVLNKRFTDQQTKIDLSGFAKGLYFVKINDGERVKVKRLVKD